MSKAFKNPKKKVSEPRHQIEFVERKLKPMNLEKKGQYSPYWKGAAAQAKEL